MICSITIPFTRGPIKKDAIIPINRRIPIIFDEYVDPAFGTGALKVTPAHDLNDYNLGLKHTLEVVDTLNPDGTLSEAAQIFVGEDRFVAREKTIAALKLPKLEHLSVGHNQLASLDGLQNSPLVYWLNFKENPVTDSAALKSFTNKYVYIAK